MKLKTNAIRQKLKGLVGKDELKGEKEETEEVEVIETSPIKLLVGFHCKTNRFLSKGALR